MMLPLSIVAVLLFASTGISAEEFVNEWRKAMCDKGSQTMFQEIDACFRNESKAVIEAQEDCAKEAYPTSNGNLVEFVTEACKNVPLFTKFDDCIDEYEANSAFKNQMETAPEVQECYEKVFEKYDLTKIRNNLKAKMTKS